MALTVEDGTGVTGADSLVTRQEYIDYASAVGTTIADDSEADQELVDAMRFIDSLEPYLQSYRMERDQALSFPRPSLYIDGWYYESTDIPQVAKDAQMEIALYIHAGNDPYNPTQRKYTTKERVEGAVEVQYRVTGNYRTTQTERWELLLSKLYRHSGMTVLERS